MSEPRIFFPALFDANDTVSIVQRKLPHWSQAGTLCFITFRTKDSIPRAILEEWQADRRRWLRTHGIDAGSPTWSADLNSLPLPLQAEFKRTFSQRWHAHLDACHGECVLKKPELASIVAASLRHFDGERYILTDYVVMPNHVHLIAAFASEDAMLHQCESWKHYTATQINRLLARRGKFWQQDGFDHLIRTEDQFHRVRRYIRDNPSLARLAMGEFVHYSRVLGISA